MTRLTLYLSSLLPPPCLPRVRIQNVPVCALKTFPCVRATCPHVYTCGHVAGTHGNVLNAHTVTFPMRTRGFSACHTTPTHTHTQQHTQTTTHHAHKHQTHHTHHHPHTPTRTQHAHNKTTAPHYATHCTHARHLHFIHHTPRHKPHTTHDTTTRVHIHTNTHLQHTHTHTHHTTSPDAELSY